MKQKAMQTLETDHLMLNNIAVEKWLQNEQ